MSSLQAPKARESPRTATGAIRESIMIPPMMVKAFTLNYLAPSALGVDYSMWKKDTPSAWLCQGFVQYN